MPEGRESRERDTKASRMWVKQSAGNKLHSVSSTLSFSFTDVSDVTHHPPMKDKHLFTVKSFSLSLLSFE